MTGSAAYLARYQSSLLGVFGTPALVLDHGQGCWVYDVEGRRYLDLIGGIAVNTLGHNHPPSGRGDPCLQLLYDTRPDRAGRGPPSDCPGPRRVGGLLCQFRR